MRAAVGNHFLRLLGVLCAAAGVLAWLGVAWRAISDPDGLTPGGDAGGRLVNWGLSGTVLMIAGSVLLHVVASTAEQEEREESAPPR